MTALPSVNAPLVDQNRAPTPVLLGLLPDLPVGNPVVERDGTATTAFRAELQAALGGLLPGQTTPLVNADGTPTRAMVMLLQRLA